MVVEIWCILSSGGMPLYLLVSSLWFEEVHVWSRNVWACNRCVSMYWHSNIKPFCIVYEMFLSDVHLYRYSVCMRSSWQVNSDRAGKSCIEKVGVLKPMHLKCWSHLCIPAWSVVSHSKLSWRFKGQPCILMLMNFVTICGWRILIWVRPQGTVRYCCYLRSDGLIGHQGFSLNYPGYRGSSGHSIDLKS